MKIDSSVGTPLLFVFLWSSAYIAFELCSPHVEPATFVVVRTTITAMILFYIVLIGRTGWPSRRIEFYYSILVGILLHGVYAGGVFYSVDNGIDLKLCALILSLQPIMTVILSTIYLGEKITARKVFGVLVGGLGVSIMILEGNPDTAQVAMQNRSYPGQRPNYFAIYMCFVALMGISTATIVQKRYCSGIPIMSSACIQYTAAAVFMLPFAMIFETTHVDWNIDFAIGLSWLVICVSIGAMSLLMKLIKNGDAGTVANLFYLVTPLVAIEAWLLFDEKITFISLCGMLLCIAGVVVVNNTSVEKPEMVPARIHRKKIFGFAVRNIHVQIDHVKLIKPNQSSNERTVGSS